MTSDDLRHLPSPAATDLGDDGPGVTLTDLLTWLGEGKRRVLATALVAGVIGAGIALLLPKEYTSEATYLAPGSQQQGGSAAAMAALGSLGGLVGASAKSPDELYVALLKSDSVLRALDERFKLQERYEAKTFTDLRKRAAKFIAVTADKKSGLISVDVTDKDPKFAATLANAEGEEVTKVLGRLAVTEAQLRRVFFEKQMLDTKENLVKAEQYLATVQQQSGVISLDKQAEALLTAAAQLRANIATREVQLKVLLTTATEQNPEVIRLKSEIRAMQTELARMDSTKSVDGASVYNLPVGKLPEAGIEYVRARRDLKLQETLLESMVRQFEAAKLDEAKEGQQLQEVDIAEPPDQKSRPARALITLGFAFAGFLLSSLVVIFRRYGAWSREHFPEDAQARRTMARAWRWRG